MATIRKRVRKDGTASYQVRWLQGGRGGTWEAEGFEDVEQADAFKKLVDAHKQRWPYGWVPGRGFVEPEDPDDVLLTGWARATSTGSPASTRGPGTTTGARWTGTSPSWCTPPDRDW